jgi:hypothetical protein
MKALAQKLSSLGYFVDSKGEILQVMSNNSPVVDNFMLTSFIKDSESKRVKRRRVHV